MRNFTGGPRGRQAGLYLAALYLREGGPVAGAGISFGGDDRLVSEYMESEFLARISRRRRAFLTRTAVLERMCGSLCDAVLEGTAERWLWWLEDHGAMANQPATAVMAAMLSAMTGKPGEADRRAGVAEQAAAVATMPDGSASVEPWLALLRALLCRGGVEQMQADAELAARTMAAGSFWRTAATLFLGLAHLMAGDPARADVLFADAAARGQAGGATTGTCLALAERSLLAIAQGAWESGERHLSEAWGLARDANLED